MMEGHLERIADLCGQGAAGEPFAALVAVGEIGPDLFDGSGQDTHELHSVFVEAGAVIAHQINPQLCSCRHRRARHSWETGRRVWGMSRRGPLRSGPAWCASPSWSGSA